MKFEIKHRWSGSTVVAEKIIDPVALGLIDAPEAAAV